LDNKKTTYSKIASTTLLFGSSQIVVMITSIIRTKFVALFLGTSGYGILSLYTSTIGLISAFSNLGIGTSAVRDLAEASASNQEKRIQKVVFIIRKLSWITGSLGAIMTVVFSVQISTLVFDTPEFWPGICWLSITIFLNQLSSANGAILRGLRRNKKLANANVTGALFGLLISIPMYYFLGNKAIVPTLIVSSFITYLRSWYFTRDIIINEDNIKGISVSSEGKMMIWTGILLSITTILTLTKALVIKLYIEKNGGINEVGLYQASFVIVNTYFGIIFTVMSTDYFPTLAANKENKVEVKAILNKQLVFGLSLLLPLISLFLLFNKQIISILFSNKFAPAESMIAWSILGITFKLFGWCHSYLLLSQGHNKIYFWNEFLAILITLFISIVGYYFFNLDGLGIGFMVGFAYYSIQTHLICNKLYGNYIDLKSYIILVFCLFLTSALFVLIEYKVSWILLFFTGFISISTSIYLYKRMGLLDKLIKPFKKNG
jgi:O-antigen/teichoic acid export membrane protein